MILKRIGFLTVALSFAAVASAQTTVKVDGVGDGDGDTVDDFDTIKLAINSLGVNGSDGQPDTINVVVNTPIVHTDGIVINQTAAAIGTFNSHTDSITINGNADADGTLGTIVLGGVPNSGTGLGVNNSRFAIEVGQNRTVTVQNMFIVPTFLGAGALNTALDAAVGVDEADGAATSFNGATINFNNVVFTASTTGNVPVLVEDAPTTDITRFSGNGGVLANSMIGWGSSPATAAGSSTMNITNCKFGHWTSHVASSARAAVVAAQDSFAGSNHIININGCLFRNAVPGLGSVYAVRTVNGSNAVVNISNSSVIGTVSNTFLYGLEANAVATGATARINVGEGVVISGMNQRGISALGGTGTGQNILDIAGFTTSPVTLVNNGNRAVRTEITGGVIAPQFKRLKEAIITDNGVYALELNEVDHQNGVGPIEDSLFAYNGDTVTSPAQIRIGDTNTVAASVAINRSTFHDCGRGLAATSGTSHLLISAGGADNLTYTFTDCIFSGTTGDRAVLLSAGDNNTVNITSSSLVLAGPDALNPAPIQIEAAATGSVVNQTAVINNDPIYLSKATNPVVANSFDVDNNPYLGKGSVAQPNLSGWGDYIGSVPVSMSSFEVE